MLRVERGTELFPFLAVLGGVFDALYAGHTFTLHGIRRYVSKPQKVTRSRASATRYCKSRNDAIHTRKRENLHKSGKYCSFSPDFTPALPENLWKSGSFGKCSQFYL